MKSSLKRTMTMKMGRNFKNSVVQKRNPFGVEPAPPGTAGTRSAFERYNQSIHVKDMVAPQVDG